MFAADERYFASNTRLRNDLVTFTSDNAFQNHL